MRAIRHPKDRKYSSNHEWVKQSEDLFVVGITAPILKRIGTLVAVELPGFDDEMMVGVPFGAVESATALHEMMPPGDAVVMEMNETMLCDFDVLAADPYEAGWLLKIRMHDPTQLGEMMDAEGYEEYCKKLWRKKAKRG